MSTANLPRDQALRVEAVTRVCEKFADNGWLLLLGIVLAAALLNARSAGALQ